MSGWTPNEIYRLRELATAGMIAVDIGADLGKTELSIITFCARNAIKLIRYSPEQQAIYDQRAKDREIKRLERRRAASHQRKVAERAAVMAKADFSPVVVKATFNKTSKEYRRQLGPMPEMSKAALREMFAEVARNTAALPIPAEAS